MSKIFGIGLPRSGGQSLWRALSILTGSCIHSPGNRLDSIEANPAAVEVFLPIGLLDAEWPDSKYIFNVRDTMEWLRSCESVYPVSAGWNHPLWKYPLSAFWWYHDNYVECVMDEANRWNVKDRFLTHDFTREPSWEPLCEFLEVDVPNIPFPRVDRVKERHHLFR